MASALARFQEPDVTARRECENCGATAGLLRCGRCHGAWFCSRACQRSYWPFHRASCAVNEFADAAEARGEPRFAAWMRGHGKLAVLQDDEVERLERASKPGGWWGLGRDEVMARMYGRLDPSPAAPSYEASRAPPQEAAVAAEEEGSAGAGGERAWRAIEVPGGLGLAVRACLKWRQNLTHVEVFLRLPGSSSSSSSSSKGRVSVTLGPHSLSVVVAGEAVLEGRLAAGIKAEDSTWVVEDGVLHLQLLKRNRKGAYADGCTAADTFWRSLLAGARGVDVLLMPGQHPPTAYYTCGEGVDA